MPFVISRLARLASSCLCIKKTQTRGPGVESRQRERVQIRLTAFSPREADRNLRNRRPRRIPITKTTALAIWATNQIKTTTVSLLSERAGAMQDLPQSLMDISGLSFLPLTSRAPSRANGLREKAEATETSAPGPRAVARPAGEAIRDGPPLFEHQMRQGVQSRSRDL